MWQPVQAFDRSSRLMLAALVFCALLLLLSLLRPQREPGRLPPYTYAQGYYTELPRLGLVRVIPIAGNALLSPPCDAGAPLSRQNSLPY